MASAHFTAVGSPGPSVAPFGQAQLTRFDIPLDPNRSLSKGRAQARLILEEGGATMHVIGAGVGRTGTRSLKLAISQLGLGPCHHMEDVISNMPRQVPLWAAAVKGRPDWATIYKGYESACDWPTARFFRELHAVYPSAKFVLTQRSPESWVESFSETIYKALAGRAHAPPEMHAWLEMVVDLVAQTGFPGGLDVVALTTAYIAHNEAVKAAIPANKLLVYQVKEGWSPLCAFLDMPAPPEPFPRTNNREEFWARVSGKK
jgi:Sulfotransferase domain